MGDIPGPLHGHPKCTVEDTYPSEVIYFCSGWLEAFAAGSDGLAWAFRLVRAMPRVGVTAPCEF